MFREPALPNEQGVTLLECVLTIGLLGTTVVAGLSLLQIHEVTYAAQSATGEAMFFLQREMEHVRATDYDALETMPFAAVPENAAYEVRRVVTVVNAVTRQISTEIRWTSPNGVARTESLSTVRCEGVE